MDGSASVALGQERSAVDAVVNMNAPFFSELVYKREINDFAAKVEPYLTPPLNIYSGDVWKQLGQNPPYVAKVTNLNFKDETKQLQGYPGKHRFFLSLSEPEGRVQPDGTGI